MAHPWFTKPTPWQLFRRDPARFLVRWLYERQLHQAKHGIEPLDRAITVACVSDTHCTQPEIPPGDVLLHAGDLTGHGSFGELQKQLDWLNTLPHRYKVVIGGNHDSLLDAEYVARFPDRMYEGKGTSRSDLQWGDITYLNNSSTRLAFPGRSLSIYGSPWTEKHGTFAFQYPAVRDVWTETVPLDTDVLLTHGPPKGHLDLGGKGCPQLLREVWRVRPRLVVFGHIHAGHGQETIAYDGVQASYDAVMTGDRGLMAVLAMAIQTLWRWLQTILNPNRQNASRRTKLVNAAAVGGFRNDQQMPIAVVHI